MDIREHKEHKVFKVFREFLDNLMPKESKELTVCKAYKDLLVTSKELKVSRVVKEGRVFKV